MNNPHIVWLATGSDWVIFFILIVYSFINMQFFFRRGIVMLHNVMVSDEDIQYTHIACCPCPKTIWADVRAESGIISFLGLTVSSGKLVVGKMSQTFVGPFLYKAGQKKTKTETLLEKDFLEPTTALSSTWKGHIVNYVTLCTGRFLVSECCHLVSNRVIMLSTSACW